MAPNEMLKTIEIFKEMLADDEKLRVSFRKRFFTDLGDSGRCIFCGADVEYKWSGLGGDIVCEHLPKCLTTRYADMLGEMRGGA